MKKTSNHYLILPLLLASLSCRALSPDSNAGTSEFEGYYTFGFEVSAFVPCDYDPEAANGIGYWLTDNSGFSERYFALVESTGQDPVRDYVTVYVRFQGELSSPGSYGHLGAYEREVTVTELLEMSLDGQCDN